MTDAPCPCGSGQSFEACCAPLLAGAPAATPEALMRSRYSAFVKADIGHLERSLSPAEKADFDPAQAKSWAETAEWLGLEIRATEGGGPEDQTGTVAFTARFRVQGKDQAHHETARFTRHDGRWAYAGGAMGMGTVRHKGPKVGRNDPCPCGSGKKFKVCCGR
ncbi:MAG: YchJ family protein [Alphaproteobacteria bacterium]|nr:YchJ family protein [Alphaproteobacteria bacterium]